MRLARWDLWLSALSRREGDLWQNLLLLFYPRNFKLRILPSYSLWLHFEYCKFLFTILLFGSVLLVIGVPSLFPEVLRAKYSHRQREQTSLPHQQNIHAHDLRQDFIRFLFRERYHTVMNLETAGTKSLKFHRPHECHIPVPLPFKREHHVPPTCFDDSSTPTGANYQAHFARALYSHSRGCTSRSETGPVSLRYSNLRFDERDSNMRSLHGFFEPIRNPFWELNSSPPASAFFSIFGKLLQAGFQSFEREC